MNTNKIRLYLHNYDNLKKEIKHLVAALEEYRKMNISGIKAQIITDMPICHTDTSKTELMAVTRVDYITDLENEIDSKMRLLNAINAVYFYLKEPKRSIVEMRYMIIPQGRHKYSWKEIADEVQLSEDNCRIIDCRIIRQIQLKLLDSTENKCKYKSA